MKGGIPRLCLARHGWGASGREKDKSPTSLPGHVLNWSDIFLLESGMLGKVTPQDRKISLEEGMRYFREENGLK